MERQDGICRTLLRGCEQQGWECPAGRRTRRPRRARSPERARADGRPDRPPRRQAGGSRFAGDFGFLHLRGVGLGSEAVVVAPESAGELPGEVAAGVGSAHPSGVRLELLGGFDRWARCASHWFPAFHPPRFLPTGSRSGPPAWTGGAGWQAGSLRHGRGGPAVGGAAHGGPAVGGAGEDRMNRIHRMGGGEGTKCGSKPWPWRPTRLGERVGRQKQDHRAS